MPALIIVLPNKSVRKFSDEFSKYVLQKDKVSKCIHSGLVFFRTSIHRTTNFLQVLSFNSNHPQTHRRRCVKTLFKRVETHCSTPEAKEEEMRYLKRQVSLNGNPNSFLKKDSAKKTNRHRHGNTEPLASYPLYGQHLWSSRAPTQTLWSRSCPSSRSPLMRIKDRVDPSEQPSIIYRAQCKDCSSYYTRQIRFEE